VNRRSSRFVTCPSRQIADDSRPVQARKIDDKSLSLKILPVSPTGSRFWGCYPSVFNTLRTTGGRGGTRLTCRAAVRRRPYVVPEGTRVLLGRHPALKRWAILFRPRGARVPAFVVHYRIRGAVLAQRLKGWAILFRSRGARFPAFVVHDRIRGAVLAHTLKRWAILFRPRGARVPAFVVHYRILETVLAQTLRRWAILFRPRGAGFLAFVVHCRIRGAVLAHPLKRWAMLTRSWGARVPSELGSVSNGEHRRQSGKACAA